MTWFRNILNTIQGWSDNTLKSAVSFSHPKSHEAYESPKRSNFHRMTKKQLEEYGRTLGLELDRRRSKKSLIETLEKFESNQK
jgi:hypothetical protein